MVINGSRNEMNFNIIRSWAYQQKSSINPEHHDKLRDGGAMSALRTLSGTAVFAFVPSPNLDSFACQANHRVTPALARVSGLT